MPLSPAIPGRLPRIHTIQTSYPGSSVPRSLCFLSSDPAPSLLSFQTIPLQTLCALFQSKEAPFYPQLLHRTLPILPCLLKPGASPKATSSFVALSRAIFPHAIAHISLPNSIFHSSKACILPSFHSPVHFSNHYFPVLTLTRYVCHLRFMFLNISSTPPKPLTTNRLIMVLIKVFGLCFIMFLSTPSLIQRSQSISMYNNYFRLFKVSHSYSASSQTSALFCLYFLFSLCPRTHHVTPLIILFSTTLPHILPPHYPRKPHLQLP